MHIITKYLIKVNILLLFNCSLLGNIGQLFVIPVCPTHGEKHIEAVSNLLKKRKIGGIIFMEGTVEEQKKVLQRLENEADTPLLVFQDGEWGLGMRLYDFPNLPKNLTLGAITNLELLRAYGKEVTYQCHEMGILSPLSPVVDVNSNPLNPVIGSRSFGDDPYEVSKRALAVMEGMREGGIIPCAKHFPSHGDTMVDSHEALPLIDKSFDQLRSCELVPFQTLIKHGLEMVMVGHLHIPALSSMPSSLSYEVITKLLKEQMGFGGLVITDALNMQALLNDYSLNEVFEKAFLAGSDLLLTADCQPPIIAYLIEKGIPEAMDHLSATIPEALIKKRVERILQFKKRPKGPSPTSNPTLCKSLYRNALTALGETKLLNATYLSLVQSCPDPDFEKALSRYVDIAIFSFEEIDKVPLPVLINLRKEDHLDKIPPHAIVALFDTPYALPNHPHVLLAYEDVCEMKEAVSDALFTPFTPSGKLPVQVSQEYGWEVQRNMEEDVRISESR